MCVLHLLMKTIKKPKKQEISDIMKVEIKLIYICQKRNETKPS